MKSRCELRSRYLQAHPEIPPSRISSQIFQKIDARGVIHTRDKRHTPLSVRYPHLETTIEVFHSASENLREAQKKKYRMPTRIAYDTLCNGKRIAQRAARYTHTAHRHIGIHRSAFAYSDSSAGDQLQRPSRASPLVQ